MRRLSTATLLLSFVIVALAGLWFVEKTRAQESTANAARKPVLVELFTSEGCSSCPPADVLLQKLQAQQPVSGAQVIALEEHVDYWNRDGWVDPFSSAEWTERQQTYATLIKKDPYTPELVVDGQTQLVGNNPRDAVMAIEDATRNEKTEITVEQTGHDGKGARFNVSIGKIAANSDGDAAEVWLALTEDGLHSNVGRGENAGKELQHTATLRYLHKIGVAGTEGTNSFAGTPSVKFGSHWNTENLHAIVFVQKKKSRQIVAVAAIKVNG